MPEVLKGGFKRHRGAPNGLHFQDGAGNNMATLILTYTKDPCTRVGEARGTTLRAVGKWTGRLGGGGRGATGRARAPSC